MFFVVIEGLYMMKLKLMYVEVTLLLCMLFLCWLDVKLNNLMVVCV